MKTAAKVLLIIGMVCTFYLIYPIILGIYAYKMIDNAKKKEDLMLWGILSIFFVSTLGGVFMLLIPDNEMNYEYVDMSSSDNTSYGKPEEKKEEEKDVVDKLKELKDLLDSGAISSEEYDKIKNDLLNK